MNNVAKALNKSPDEIREINFYQKGQVKVLIHVISLYCGETVIYYNQELHHEREITSNSVKLICIINTLKRCISVHQMLRRANVTEMSALCT